MWKPEVIKITLGRTSVNNLETAKEHANDIKAKTDMFGRLSACFTSIEISHTLPRITNDKSLELCSATSIVKNQQTYIFSFETPTPEQLWGLGKTSRLQPHNALGQLMYKKKIGSKAWAEEKVMGENPDPEHKK